jgi:tellurite resistance-related uncharacterized protein
VKALPEGAEPYKRTPTFTAHTVPAGLLKQHTTKEGGWAKIVVLQGRLLYRILSPESREYCLSPDVHGVVEPSVPHEVQPQGEVEFYVEFYRAPTSAGDSLAGGR